MDAPRALHYIDTRAGLESLCAQLAGHDWVALDTEFVREDTYFAQPCLIQVAVPGLVACVDTIALPDPAPLLERLHDPALIKVLHAGHQDMEIFYHLCDGRLPAPIFDTQLAAPLAGLAGQASYAALVSEVLDVRLEKAHARTDWRRRPLSPAQIEYAADDVRYLGPLHLELRSRLVALGRLDWLQEDCAALSDPARYANPPEDAWKRLRAAVQLNGGQQRVLRALAAWRETRARNEDRPRGWLLRDDALLDIARLQPSTPAELAAIPTLPPKTAARHGAALLELVRTAVAASAAAGDADTPGADRLSDEDKKLLKRLGDRVRRKAAELAIDPAAIATRRDLLALLHGETEIALLQGWRRGVVGEELLTLLPTGASA